MLTGPRPGCDGYKSKFCLYDNKHSGQKKQRRPHYLSITNTAFLQKIEHIVGNLKSKYHHKMWLKICLVQLNRDKI